MSKPASRKGEITHTDGIRLWDFRETPFSLTVEETKAIADFGKRLFVKQNIIAMVAPDDLTYATCRAFGVYREEEAHSTTKVFRLLEEALLWIEEKKSTGL